MSIDFSSGVKDESTFTKGLTFTYDDADRLIGSIGLHSYGDTEGGIIYDKNGNIKTRARAGAAVDNLTYAYSGNRLSSINDTNGDNSGVKNGTSSYSYDVNGNITHDGRYFKNQHPQPFPTVHEHFPEQSAFLYLEHPHLEVFEFGETESPTQPNIVNSAKMYIFLFIRRGF